MSADPSTVVIRHATPADIPGVLRCLARAFEPYRTRYTREAYEDTTLTAESAEQRLRVMTVLVAFDPGGSILGTIAHEMTHAGVGHVRGMAVDPGKLGSGLAAQLLEAAEGELRARGCRRVTLDTTEPLQRAIRFYTRCGFRPTGTVKDFFGMPLFEYAKELA
jgi:GNAT superfamily N-acetyltransferase